jgi:hypothetical protein
MKKIPEIVAQMRAMPPRTPPTTAPVLLCLLSWDVELGEGEITVDVGSGPDVVGDDAGAAEVLDCDVVAVVRAEELAVEEADDDAANVEAARRCIVVAFGPQRTYVYVCPTPCVRSSIIQ